VNLHRPGNFLGSWRQWERSQSCSVFACGLVPALLTLLIRAWVPESPRWLVRIGRPEEARRLLAWALQVSPASLPLPKLDEAATRQTAWSDLFRYARGLFVSWLSNLGMQTTGYGVILWAPTLFVMLLGVSPAQASYLFIFLSLAGFVGRFGFCRRDRKTMAVIARARTTSPAACP
jgi:putative MFS transporter